MAESLGFFIDRLATPIGELIVIADSQGRLRTIDWTDHEARMKQLLDRHYGKGRYTLTPRRDPGGLTSAMRRYFRGEIGVLKDHRFFVFAFEHVPYKRALQFTKVIVRRS